MASTSGAANARPDKDSNPHFDLGRTTADADMARWAFEHRLWGIGKVPGLSLHDHQTQDKASLPATIYARPIKLTLRDTPQMPVFLRIAIDSLRPRISLELRFWPRPTDSDGQTNARYNDPSQRVMAEFSAYVEEDFGAQLYAQRVPAHFDRPGAYPVPHDERIHNFSSQLFQLQVERVPGERLMPLHGTDWRAQGRNLEQLLLARWCFSKPIRYNCVQGPLVLAKLSDAQRARIDEFWRAIDALDGSRQPIEVAARFTEPGFGVSWLRFCSLPSPMPQTYWPWVRRLAKKRLRKTRTSEPEMAMQLSTGRGGIELDAHWVARAFAKHDGPGKSSNMAITAFRQRPAGYFRTSEPPTRARTSVSAHVQFAGSADYLAHVLGGYAYTRAAERQQRWSVDGAQACTIVPDLQRGSSAYLVLMQVKETQAAVGPSSPDDEHARPEPGTPVSITFPGRVAWQGTVLPMPANLGAKYDVAIGAVRPDAADGVGEHYEIKRTTHATGDFVFGWSGMSQERHYRIVATFFLQHDDGDGSREHRRLHSLLMGRMDKNPAWWYTTPSEALVKTIRTHVKHLNLEQQDAVWETFQNPLTLLHGPPGTGKTSVIRQVLRVATASETKFAVFAESNAAVDVIVDRFVKDHGLQPPGYYRVHPTILDEMASETTAHAAFDARRERLLMLDGFELAEEADVWRSFRGLRPQGQRPLSLANQLLERMDLVLRGKVQKNRGEWYEGEVERMKKIARLRDALHRAEDAALEAAAAVSDAATVEPDGDSVMAEPDGSDDDDEEENANTPETPEQTLARQAARITQLVGKCFKAYVTRAKGIFTTFAKSSTRMTGQFRPHLIIIDEASQAMEGSAVFPLVHHVQHWHNVLLVGDHLQLPPCVMTTEANNPFQQQCELSMFERLINAGYPNVCSLRTQYRMDPSISRVVNRVIYSGTLVDGPNTLDGLRPGVPQIRRWLGGLWRRMSPAPVPAGVTLLVEPRRMPGYHWGCSRRPGSPSVANAQTATLSVLLAYEALTQAGVRGSEIYIATFYRAQQAVIRALIAGLDVFEGVSVVTVDASQGSERDVVILDCVRLGHGASESMGFLGVERRRFCVAMSRARKCLLVVGHSSFTDKRHGAWHEYCAAAVHEGRVLRDDGTFLRHLPRGAREAAVKGPVESSALMHRLADMREMFEREYQPGGSRAAGAADAREAAGVMAPAAREAERKRWVAAVEMAERRLGGKIGGHVDDAEGVVDVEERVFERMFGG